MHDCAIWAVACTTWWGITWYAVLSGFFLPFFLSLVYMPW
jgi:hypothetical protein